MSYRILVVEDEPDLQLLWRTILERSGFSVIEASNARDGLVLARSESPDLIILDGRLPDVSGWDVLESLSADPVLGGTPVLVVTADPSAGSRAEARGLARDRFLLKPVKIEDLISAVRRALP